MIEFFLHNLWLWKCELPETVDTRKCNVPDYDTLFKTQDTDEFKELHTYAHNRMVMGAFRYGDIHRQDIHKFDVVKEAHKRLRKYEKDHNLEHLVDSYNMIRIEYFKARKMGKSMTCIDDGEHAKPKE